MDWVVSTSDSIVQTGLWLVGLGVVFGVLGAWMPCNRGKCWWRDIGAAATDLLYWLVTPIVMRLGRTLLLAAGTRLIVSGPVIGDSWALWHQCLAVFVIQDVLLYWIHRLFHTPGWWRFHAVHHAPTTLDWPAAARFHVVNHLLAFTLVDVVVLLLGFSPEALLLLAPLNTIYSSLVHANLNWTFGPLRYVLASPVFHRWHHTSEGEAIDQNFAPTLPILDVLFGTFHMPPGRVPEHFGIDDADFPADFWGQFLRPFQGWFASAAPEQPEPELVASEKG